jgi:hypothetical protein
VLERAVVNASIPDFKAGALGIYVTLSNISVDAFDLDPVDISLVPPNRLHVAAGVRAKATMHWRYHDGVSPPRRSDIFIEHRVGDLIFLPNTESVTRAQTHIWRKMYLPGSALSPASAHAQLPPFPMRVYVCV